MTSFPSLGLAANPHAGGKNTRPEGVSAAESQELCRETLTDSEKKDIRNQIAAVYQAQVKNPSREGFTKSVQKILNNHGGEQSPEIIREMQRTTQALQEGTAYSLALERLSNPKAKPNPLIEQLNLGQSVRAMEKTLGKHYESLTSRGITLDPKTGQWDFSKMASKNLTAKDFQSGSPLNDALKNVFSPDLAEKLADPNRTGAIQIGNQVLRPPGPSGEVRGVAKEEQDQMIKDNTERLQKAVSSFEEASKNANTYSDSMKGRLWDRGATDQTANEVDRTESLKMMDRIIKNVQAMGADPQVVAAMREIEKSAIDKDTAGLKKLDAELTKKITGLKYTAAALVAIPVVIGATAAIGGTAAAAALMGVGAAGVTTSSMATAAGIPLAIQGAAMTFQAGLQATRHGKSFGCEFYKAVHERGADAVAQAAIGANIPGILAGGAALVAKGTNAVVNLAKAERTAEQIAATAINVQKTVGAGTGGYFTYTGYNGYKKENEEIGKLHAEAANLRKQGREEEARAIDTKITQARGEKLVNTALTLYGAVKTGFSIFGKNTSGKIAAKDSEKSTAKKPKANGLGLEKGHPESEGKPSYDRLLNFIDSKVVGRELPKGPKAIVQSDTHVEIKETADGKLKWGDNVAGRSLDSTLSTIGNATAKGDAPKSILVNGDIFQRASFQKAHKGDPEKAADLTFQYLKQVREKAGPNAQIKYNEGDHGIPKLTTVDTKGKTVGKNYENGDDVLDLKFSKQMFKSLQSKIDADPTMKNVELLGSDPRLATSTILNGAGVNGRDQLVDVTHVDHKVTAGLKQDYKVLANGKYQETTAAPVGRNLPVVEGATSSPGTAKPSGGKSSTDFVTFNPETNSKGFAKSSGDGSKILIASDSHLPGKEITVIDGANATLFNPGAGGTVNKPGKLPQLGTIGVIQNGQANHYEITADGVRPYNVKDAAIKAHMGEKGLNWTDWANTLSTVPYMSILFPSLSPPSPAEQPDDTEASE